MTKKKKGCLITSAIFIVIIFVMVLLGSSESVNWDLAMAENTIKSYTKYIKRFPNGIHVSKADSLKTILIKNDTPFIAAQKKGTEEALQDFLSDYPGHQREKKAVEELEDLKNYNIISKEDFYTDYEKYINKFPNGTHIDTAKKRIAWLKSHSAVVEIEYPKILEQSRSPYSNVSSPFWGWNTVLKETSGKIGFKVKRGGYILDRYGKQWVGNYNDELTVLPGESKEADYWLSSPDHGLCNGYAIFDWSGEDAGGHPIRIEEKVKLQHKDCPVK